MADDFSSWIGRMEEQSGVIHGEPARFLRATLDLQTGEPVKGDTLPPLWHWLYFLSAQPRSGLGRDGHAARGGFLPPVRLPRRMWAGGRFEFHRPLQIGAAARKRSVIADIKMKEGRSGKLCFVTVRHDIRDGGGLCVREAQDLVYREAPGADAVAPARPDAPPDAQVSEVFEPDPVLLFRFSALTFNGHRIHYDRDYARNVENYRDLVVHGPLTALLLCGLAMRLAGTGQLRSFSFRAVSPLFVDRPFTLNARHSGSGLDLWAADPDGKLAVTAKADPGTDEKNA